MDPRVIYAFSLTLLAGLSTGIGSMIAFFSRRTSTSFLSISLGFSAGVMIYVSFLDILPVSLEHLKKNFGDDSGSWMVSLAFFGGMGIIALIDFFVPDPENPHELRDVEEMSDSGAAEARKSGEGLLRMGLFSALAIGIHNFPEGLATFTSALVDPSTGFSIAMAIAIHNIPEGIAVSVPIYFATGSRKKAFTLSFLSGLSEPIGALVGYLILLPFLNDGVYGILFAAVAGIMVFISFDELLPAAEKYGKHHHAIYGLIGGMGIMALSLALF